MCSRSIWTLNRASESPEPKMLTAGALKSYLLEMPSGHIFDLPYDLFASVFPPGEPDAGSRESLRILAEDCHCDIKSIPAEQRIELIKRRPGNY
jgi:hypothetical protein